MIQEGKLALPGASDRKEQASHARVFMMTNCRMQGISLLAKLMGLGD